ncbi:MAG: cation transporter [Galbitalea sp.]
MSCEHCVTSVTNELTRMDGIMSVGVDLVSGRVAVTSARPLMRATCGPRSTRPGTSSWAAAEPQLCSRAARPSQ